MKLCRACGETKPLAEFWPRRARGPNAVQSKCKPCNTKASLPGRRKYKKTEKGVAATRRHESGTGRVARAARIERYKADGRLNEVHRRKRGKRAEFYRTIHAAHEAVRRALIAGAMVRPLSCEKCGTACKPDAHHHNGYEGPARFDVQWLCRACHVHVDVRAKVNGKLATWGGTGMGDAQ